MTLKNYVWPLLSLCCCAPLACAGTRAPAPSKLATESISESPSGETRDAALAGDEDEAPAEEEADEGGEAFAEAEAAEESPAEEKADEGFSDGGADAEHEKKERPVTPMKTAALVEKLETKVTGLDEALEGEELSCGGAGPFRDAICSIADRICELGPVSKRCVDAKASCVRAKKRFDEKCES